MPSKAAKQAVLAEPTDAQRSFDDVLLEHVLRKLNTKGLREAVLEKVSDELLGSIRTDVLVETVLGDREQERSAKLSGKVIEKLLSE